MQKSQENNFHIQRGNQVFHDTVCASGITRHLQKLKEPRGLQRWQTPALGWHAAVTVAEAQGRADHARGPRSPAGTRREREHKIKKAADSQVPTVHSGA